ncbi:MAG: hypothetical protein Q7T89_12275 [Anaerolineales bacterium]|nr:hypothetical protein [Anaerolineales bacterium]
MRRTINFQHPLQYPLFDIHLHPDGSTRFAAHRVEGHVLQRGGLAVNPPSTFDL